MTGPALPDNVDASNVLPIRDIFQHLIRRHNAAMRTLLQCAKPHGFTMALGDGRAIGHLFWQALAVEHLQLATICDAVLPALPEQPTAHDGRAMLAWYDQHLAQDYERLSQLSANDLLKNLEFLGECKPVWAYLPHYFELILQNRGLLAGYLAAAETYQVTAAGAPQSVSAQPQPPMNGVEKLQATS